MAGNPVVFKGTRGGLKIYLSEQAGLSDIKSAIHKKLTSGKPFFQGATVNLTFIGRAIDEEQREELIELTAKHMEVGSVVFKELDEKEEICPSQDHFESFDGIDEGMTRFIRGTVRSGQRIYYEGNVVVVGDVNPGGEVIAGGNILVLGTLRGIAHAGATGNQRAVVASYCLQPTQLRIASMITRAPEGDNMRPEYPEISYIKNDHLIIEPYLPGKGK